MKKEEIRKEFFKLKNKGYSYFQCVKILKAQFDYEITSRTLQIWNEKLMKTEWDLKDKSKRPTTIYFKINSKIEQKILDLRNKTGFGERKIENFVEVGHTSINKILRKYKLTNPSKRKKKRR